MNEEEKVVSEKELKQEGETTLLEGKPFNGVCIDFSENGQKSFEGHFNKGKEEGLTVIWYKNGQKNIEKYYKNGKEEGLWIEWSEEGKKTYEVHFQEGNEL